MKLINTKPETPFQDKTFQLELTGQELVALYALSYKNEAGPAFPAKDNDRFCGKIEALFPGVEFRLLMDRLVAGKVI